MEQHEHLVAKADILLGTGGIFSPLWVPLVADLDWAATKAALWGGGLLVLIRVAIATRDWLRDRRGGER